MIQWTIIHFRRFCVCLLYVRWVWDQGSCWGSFFFFFSFFFLSFLFFPFFPFLKKLFNFTILYWFCHISTWIRHRYTRVPHPEPSSLLPPRTIHLSHPSAPTPSIQYRASNLHCSNTCPLSQWCHPTISSSVTLFASCPQSFPASAVDYKYSISVPWGECPMNWDEDSRI